MKIILPCRIIFLTHKVKYFSMVCMIESTGILAVTKQNTAPICNESFKLAVWERNDWNPYRIALEPLSLLPDLNVTKYTTNSFTYIQCNLYSRFVRLDMDRSTPFIALEKYVWVILHCFLTTTIMSYVQTQRSVK